MISTVVVRNTSDESSYLFGAINLPKQRLYEYRAENNAEVRLKKIVALEARLAAETRESAKKMLRNTLALLKADETALEEDDKKALTSYLDRHREERRFFIHEYGDAQKAWATAMRMQSKGRRVTLVPVLP